MFSSAQKLRASTHALSCFIITITKIRRIYQVPMENNEVTSMWNILSTKLTRNKSPNLQMCDQWQTIITSTLIRSLRHAPLTGGMLLIANTGTLNTSQPRPGPWTHPPGDHTSPSSASALRKSPQIKQIPARRWQKYTGNRLSLPSLMVSRHLVSYDRKLPVDNQSLTKVCTVESSWMWPNYIPQNPLLYLCLCVMPTRAPQTLTSTWQTNQRWAHRAPFAPWHLSNFICLPFPLWQTVTSWSFTTGEQKCLPSFSKSAYSEI